ncbi:unnamed protein product [Fraxinus pennsylvanica]|uniref:Large ribosomal subunit protein bL12c n=1 Tax=Fraxinus pennsylvanica TaxID=56036 RepID=A0AAD1Z882_9LAMI|nr:unnamed protein product [Fraxinus pennsylvanica]
MKLAAVCRLISARHNLRRITRPLQYRSFQPDFVPRDPNAKLKKYKFPAFYDPYGLRPPPSEKIIQLAEQIASLTPEERSQIGPAVRDRAEDKKAEKTTFDVKLEKFEAAAKIKVIKEVRAFTDLGLKEAKELVEKVPVILEQQLTKDEANSIIEKIKAAGGVAVME